MIICVDVESRQADVMDDQRLRFNESRKVREIPAGAVTGWCPRSYSIGENNYLVTSTRAIRRVNASLNRCIPK